jgi:hypothetical protein
VNRVLLTGDYVYFAEVSSGGSERGFYRWRGNYVQPASRSQYGERRLKVWVPWIRTAEDSRQFIREMFRVYSQPVSKYLIHVQATGGLPLPWEGRVRIESKEGEILAEGTPETIRIDFDRVPILSLTLGPEDPQTHWPEPPHDERWETHDLQLNPGGGSSDQLTFESDETDIESTLSDETSEESFSSGSSSSVESTLSEESSGDSSETGDISDESGSETDKDISDESGITDESNVSEDLSSDESGGETESLDEDSNSDNDPPSSSEEETEVTSDLSDETSESDFPSGSDDETDGSSDGDQSEEDTSGGDNSDGEESGGDESGGGDSEESQSEGDQSGEESDDDEESSGQDPSDDESGGSDINESSDVSSDDVSDESEGTIIVACCEDPLPPVLHANFHNDTDCGDWDGVTAELTSLGGGSWSGEVTDGPDPVSIQLSCRTTPTPRWSLEVNGDPCEGSATAGSVISCSPLTVEFADFSLGLHCCATHSGRVTITITE